MEGKRSDKFVWWQNAFVYYYLVTIEGALRGFSLDGKAKPDFSQTRFYNNDLEGKLNV